MQFHISRARAAAGYHRTHVSQLSGDGIDGKCGDAVCRVIGHKGKASSCYLRVGHLRLGCLCLGHLLASITVTARECSNDRQGKKEGRNSWFHGGTPLSLSSCFKIRMTTDFLMKNGRHRAMYTPLIFLLFWQFEHSA